MSRCLSVFLLCVRLLVGTCDALCTKITLPQTTILCSFRVNRAANAFAAIADIDAELGEADGYVSSSIRPQEANVIVHRYARWRSRREIKPTDGLQH